MELRKQVVSLDLAKRLKELGVPQESVIYWLKMAYGYELMIGGKPELDDDEYSAFTVAELGELLPCGFTNRRGTSFLIATEKTVHGTWFCYARAARSFASPFPVLFSDHTEAEARGRFLEYLLSQKSMSLGVRNETES